MQNAESGGQNAAGLGVHSAFHHSAFCTSYLCPSPLRTMSVLIRCRANATFWALLIFEKSGETSPFFGNPPLVDTGTAAGAAPAGAWTLRGDDGAPVEDIVTFGRGFA